MEWQSLGKWLIGAGMLLVILGAVLTVAGKIPWLGRLPGDVYIKKDHFSFYFPLTTCLILSLLLSLFFRFFGRK